jgi:hypothetical protein
MRDFLLDEQAFQVLKSFQPYFGNRGNQFLGALESVQNLLKSEAAQKVAENLRLFGWDNYPSLEVKSEATTKPYNLFMVLAMMFAADLPGGIKQS